jgi:hypothetical protein
MKPMGMIELSPILICSGLEVSELGACDGEIIDEDEGAGALGNMGDVLATKERVEGSRGRLAAALPSSAA